MSADASELYRLAADLHLVSATTQPKVRQVIVKGLHDIEADAKIGAPVDTGNLRNSISTELDPDGMGGVVGPTAEYGIYQETGTSTQSGQPFLGPAFDRHSPIVSKLLADLAIEGI